MTDNKLKAFLEECYLTYHRPEFLPTDPLVCLRRFSAPADLEIAGLIAAMLAYGRVETILRSVDDAFARMDHAPADFALNASPREKRSRLHGFVHRFNQGAEIAAVLHAAGAVIRRYGSLQSLFVSGLARDTATIARPLDRFTIALKQPARRLAPDRGAQIDFLLSSPSSGSACKRMNMYLRWMIRPRDGIDLGVWNCVSPALLIVPLDTHVARIARSLCLSSRATADWTMAEEVTGALRRIAPFDPVRFDFSLCRAGMSDYRRRAA